MPCVKHKQYTGAYAAFQLHCYHLIINIRLLNFRYHERMIACNFAFVCLCLRIYVRDSPLFSLANRKIYIPFAIKIKWKMNKLRAAEYFVKICCPIVCVWLCRAFHRIWINSKMYSTVY